LDEAGISIAIEGDSQPFLGFLSGFLTPRVSWIELLKSPKMPWPIRQNWVSCPSAVGGEVRSDRI